MVAQHKAISKATSETTKTATSETRATTLRRRMASVQPRRSASDGDDVDPSRELLEQLHALQAMRADALAWLAEIERRIEELELVMFRSEDIGG